MPYPISCVSTLTALSGNAPPMLYALPFSRITIHDITELCGIRRQHFYYHFEDVYNLLRWMFQEEAVSLLHQHEGALLWQDGLLQLFHYIDANRAVCLCALNSVGRDCLKRFFEGDIHAVIYRAAEQIGEQIGALDTPDADIEMITHFYVVSTPARFRIRQI